VRRCAANREGACLDRGSGPSIESVEAEYVGGIMVLRTKGDVAARDRLSGVFLAASVVFVQLTWGAALVYLGFRFL
jgi:hypothetical protein